MSSTTSANLHSPPPDLSGRQVSLSERILSLDVLRGIAVLSALFVSVWVFGGFSDNQRDLLLVKSKGTDYRLYGTVDLLFTGKMRALIAIVFGAAMIYFLNRDDAPGKQPRGDIFIKRQIWLMVFGIVNAFLLLWPMDILFHLGLMGLMLFPFFRMTPKILFITALVITLIYSGKFFWDYSDDKKSYSKYLVAVNLEKKYEKDSIAKAKAGQIVKKDTLTKFQKQDKQQWEGKIAGMKPDIKKDDENNKAMRSNDYGKVWNQNIPTMQTHQAQWTYRFGIWDLAGMMFLGMMLYKLGFFSHAFSRNRYLLIALTGIAGGLLFGWIRIHFHQLALQDYEKYVKQYSLPYEFLFPLERALMAIGYSALLMALLSLGFLKKLWQAFSAVGRMALSNYILQTIICTIFFYGYGFGYFAKISQVNLYFFVAELTLIQVVFSVIWLKYFHIGPLEWLIRRWSYGKRGTQAMRKPSSDEPVITIFS